MLVHCSRCRGGLHPGFLACLASVCACAEHIRGGFHDERALHLAKLASRRVCFHVMGSVRCQGIRHKIVCAAGRIGLLQFKSQTSPNPKPWNSNPLTYLEHLKPRCLRTPNLKSLTPVEP